MTPDVLVSEALDRLVIPAIRKAALWLAHGDEVLADDLAQEGLLAAHQAAGRWREDGGVGLRPWVMTRARLKMMAALGGELRLVTDPIDEDFEQGDDGDQAEATERAIELRQRLARLRPKERAQFEARLAGVTPRREDGRGRAAVRRVVRRLAG